MKRLPILLAVLTSSLAVAVTPRDLTAEQASDDPRYGVKSAPTTSNSAQPVDIMNWLIDENGNLKVSLQVRDQVVELFNAPESPIELPTVGGAWASDWLDTSRFSTLQLYMDESQPLYSRCGLEWQWIEGVAFGSAVENQASQVDAANRWPVLGRSVRVSCTGNTGYPGNTDYIRRVIIYLRAE